MVIMKIMKIMVQINNIIEQPQAVAPTGSAPKI